MPVPVASSKGDCSLHQFALLYFPLADVTPDTRNSSFGKRIIHDAMRLTTVLKEESLLTKRTPMTILP